MSKFTLFNIIDKLKSTLMKKNTKYKNTILVEIRLSCVVYKFVHGCNFLIYIKLFAIGKKTISLVPHEFVDAMNVVFRKLISWLMGVEMCSIMNDLKLWCNLLNVQGPINGTHLFIYKLFMHFSEDYYYFKSGGYSIVAHVVLDYKKFFIAIYVGLPRSTNDSRMLCRFALYKQIQLHGLFNITKGSCEDGIPPYLGDKGYPIISWIMTRCQQGKVNNFFFFPKIQLKNGIVFDMDIRKHIQFFLK